MDEDGEEGEEGGGPSALLRMTEIGAEPGEADQTKGKEAEEAGFGPEVEENVVGVLEDFEIGGFVIGLDDIRIRTEAGAEEWVVFDHRERFFPDGETDLAGPFFEGQRVDYRCTKFWSCTENDGGDEGKGESDFSCFRIPDEGEKSADENGEHAADAFGEKS